MSHLIWNPSRFGVLPFNKLSTTQLSVGVGARANLHCLLTTPRTRRTWGIQGIGCSLTQRFCSKVLSLGFLSLFIPFFWDNFFLRRFPFKNISFREDLISFREDLISLREDFISRRFHLRNISFRKHFFFGRFTFKNISFQEDFLLRIFPFSKIFSFKKISFQEDLISYCEHLNALIFL